MAKKTKYLSYLEETRKHHKIIGNAAKVSSVNAIAESHNENVPVTYLEGESIVKVNSQGIKKKIGKIENNRRKVTVGAKSKLSKK